MHVFGPPQRFPLRRPPLTGSVPLAPVAALAERCAALGIGGGIVVNPVEYGSGTECLEEALATLGSSFSGVIMAGDERDASELERLHALGVRGLRLMFPARIGLAPTDAVIAGAIDIARSFGWQLRVLAGPADWARAAAWLLPVADIPVVLEHLAICPVHEAVVGAPGYDALRALLQQPNVWLQLSGAMRLAPEAEWSALAAVARRHYDLCAGRCVWGSDWPHAGGASGDDGASLRFAARVCPDAASQQRLFSDEPQALRSFSSSDRRRSA